jgi:hypothetical protein
VFACLCGRVKASKELVDLLYDRTEGIPFYVLEYAFAMESKEFVHFYEQTWSPPCALNPQPPPPPPPPAPLHCTTSATAAATTTTTTTTAPETASAAVAVAVADRGGSVGSAATTPKTLPKTTLKVADLRLHVDAMQLPNGIKEVIVAHFDALESQVQDVLIVASVLG